MTNCTRIDVATGSKNVKFFGEHAPPPTVPNYPGLLPLFLKLSTQSNKLTAVLCS